MKTISIALLAALLLPLTAVAETRHDTVKNTKPATNTQSISAPNQSSKLDVKAGAPQPRSSVNPSQSSFKERQPARYENMVVTEPLVKERQSAPTNSHNK